MTNPMEKDFITTMMAQFTKEISKTAAHTDTAHGPTMTGPDSRVSS